MKKNEKSNQNQSEKFEIGIARQYTVVKSNDLVQKARFELSLQEQKIILYLISKVKPMDLEFQEYIFEIKEFCQICGIDYDNGKNYKNIKDTIKKLSDKSLWVMVDEKREVLLRWINTAEINKRTGMIKLELHREMKPYLLDLKAKFTHYGLIYILGMRSQYAIRLYELLKSYEYRGRWLVGIDELKRVLLAENYTVYNDFRRKVIEISLREINKLTDINVDYQAIKSGRKFIKIEFTITQKERYDEMTVAFLERTRRLG